MNPVLKVAIRESKAITLSLWLRAVVSTVLFLHRSFNRTVDKSTNREKKASLVEKAQKVW